MKKFGGIIILALLIGFSSANAQSTAKKVEQSVTKSVNKAANETAEVASKGKAATIDKVYKDKKGPNGQTIYIDKHSKYYWIDNKGHKKYVAKDELKDKH